MNEDSSGSFLRRSGFRVVGIVVLALQLLCNASLAVADLSQAELAKLVIPPYRLGQQVGTDGVWSIETSDGAPAGYIFESLPLIAIPGFGGKPMNLLITLDQKGRFLDVTILDQKEPIFVSGLGEEPFRAFVEQYRGLSIGDSIAVGTKNRSAQGVGSAHVYVDGVTMATASVRVANDSILGAALKVARARLQGIAQRAASRPLRDYREELNWSNLVAEGIARSIRVSNRELQARYAGSRWEHDDPEAEEDPEGNYLDLWVVDVGPPSVARAVLAPETVAAVQRSLSPSEEPIVLLANGRHRLVDEDFVRNSSPSRITAIQDGLPVTLRDADVETRLANGVPAFEQAMVLRADTQLGFDPVSPWTLVIRAVREHQSFQPEPGASDFELAYQAPERFFDAPAAEKSAPVWIAAVQDRAIDFFVLIVFMAPLLWVIARRLRWLARHPRYPLIRLGILVITAVFIGWWAQGQLSIVTPLGVLRSLVEGSNLTFLLYEPVILLVWAVTLVSLLVWGRGFFCGWLCPYGALQEFAYRLGRLLRLPKLRIHPGDDRRMKWVKYLVLALLVVATLTSETAADLLIELEPFKTAVTLHFDRALPFVLYAGFWLVLGLFMFKGFCRYVCPLGAALAIAGKLRRLDWIGRRTECGSPCQFCKARCAYGAIEPNGKIDYNECFQCLDCVTIIEDPALCIPERLARKKGRPQVLVRR